MALDNVSNRVVFLRCDVKFGFWNGAVAPTEFYGPINFTKLEITVAKQKMERLMSNMLYNHGTLLDSQASATDPATMSCEFDSMNGDMLALQLGASTSDLTQTELAVPDEAITPTVGVWSKLANQHIAPDATGTPIVFETVTPTTIPIENFEIDVVNGMYRPLTSLGATAVAVSYYKAARTGEIYNAGQALTRYVQLIGKAQEMSTSRMGSILIPKCSLVPNSKFDPVSNSYLKGGFDGDLVLASGYTTPWQFIYTSLTA